MSAPTIVTWYATGEPLPWRLARTNDDAALVGETRCETFSSLLVALGEAWAYWMPEPAATESALR